MTPAKQTIQTCQRLSQLCLVIATAAVVWLLAYVFLLDWKDAGFEGLKLLGAWLYGGPAIAIVALAGIIFEFIARSRQEIEKVRKRIIAANLLIAIAAGASLPALMLLDDLQDEASNMQTVKLAESGKPEDLHQASRILLRQRMNLDQQRQGFHYLQKAAEKGHALAQFELAVLYYHGRLDVVQTDEARAMGYLAKSVSNNNPTARWWKKEAVKQKRAFEDFLDKARQGDASAQCRLGQIYLHGINFALHRSRYEAAIWLSRALNNGLEDCRFLLEDLFLRYPSPWKKIKPGDTQTRVRRVLEQAMHTRTGRVSSRSKNPEETIYWARINRLYKDSRPAYEYEEWIYTHGRNRYVIVFHGQPQEPKQNWQVVYNKLFQGK